MARQKYIINTIMEQFQVAKIFYVFRRGRKQTNVEINDVVCSVEALEN